MKKYWKLFLGLLLILAAVFVYTLGYMPAKAEYERRSAELLTSIVNMEREIEAKNSSAAVTAQTVAAIEELESVRAALYGKLPEDIKEEDQVRYVIWLEEHLGEEIDFYLGDSQTAAELSDGAQLRELSLELSCSCTYEQLCELLEHLENEDRISSVRIGRMELDKDRNKINGSMTVVSYVLTEGDAEKQD